MVSSSYLEPGKGAEVGTVLDVDHISRTTGRSSPIAVLGTPRHRGRHLLLSFRAVPLNALTNVDDDFSTLRNPRAGAAFRGTFVRSFEASRCRKIKIRSRTEARACASGTRKFRDARAHIFHAPGVNQCHILLEYGHLFLYSPMQVR